MKENIPRPRERHTKQIGKKIAFPYEIIIMKSTKENKDRIIPRPDHSVPSSSVDLVILRIGFWFGVCCH